MIATYSTNHSRPWMDLVTDYGMDEAEAKRLFDRMEPLKTFEERCLIWGEAIRSTRAELDARQRKKTRPAGGE